MTAQIARAGNFALFVFILAALAAMIAIVT